MSRLYALFVLFALVSQSAAASPYLFTCASENLTLSVQEKIEAKGSTNGWEAFWGTVEYTVHQDGREVTGSVDAQIMWAKYSPHGQNVMMIGLMDKKQAESFKKGYDLSFVGFAGMDLKEDFRGNFQGKWQLFNPSTDYPVLNIPSHALTCKR